MLAKDVADKLFRLYLDHFESLYRIIHKSTAQDEYESYWLDPTSVAIPVLLQIQLCLALGACLFDDKFSLRRSALHFIGEAKAWVVSSESSRPTVKKLQLLCLLQLAQLNIIALREDLSWVSAGALYRTALSMGLHIDPTCLPNMSPFRSEIRRRLWATIIELTLQSSLDGGNLPMINLNDQSCCAPLNLDDTCLCETDSELPTASQPDMFTDTSIQVAFGHSRSVRLQILTMMNATDGHPEYDEVLRLSAELTSECRTMSACLSNYGSKISTFQRLLCETAIQPYFLALHVPYMRIALEDPLYHYSRELCVNKAVRLSHAVLAPPLSEHSMLATLRAAANMDTACEQYMRLMTCGSGPFRSVQVQNNFIMASELLAISENEIRPSFVRDGSESFVDMHNFDSLRSAELHALLTAAVAWTERRLVAGETNVKDYVFHAAMLAHIEAVKKGQRSDDVKSLKSIDVLKRAMDLMQTMVVSEPSYTDDIPALSRDGEEEDDSLWYTWLDDLGQTSWVSFPNL